MQDAQDMVRHTLLIKTETDQLLTTPSFDTLRSSYTQIAQQLESLDQLVERLATANNDVAVLDLHQSSQLFRNTANVVAQLRDSALQTEIGFAQTLQERALQLQAVGTQESLTLAVLLYALQSAKQREEIQQLQTRFVRQARAAGRLPDAVRADLAALQSRRADAIDPDARDLFSVRMNLINEREVILRFHGELRSQAGALVAAAQAQSDAFTRDYREAVQSLVAVSNRTQRWVLTMLGGSLLFTWLVVRVFMGRHVLTRLHEVSRQLRRGTVDGVPDLTRLQQDDEIGDMALAVGQFLQDRQQLEARTAELNAAQERLAQKNTLLQDEVVVRLGAEQHLRSLMVEQQSLIEKLQQAQAQLVKTQAKLVSAARLAGKAEIATNVLHNVGNVLNSVNVSAGLIATRMRDSKALGLAKAVDLMNENATDLGDYLTRDEKGKLLPGYLNKLVAALAAEQQSVVGELASLTRSVDHIKDIVATQQSYAGTSSLVEALQVKDVLEDALRVNAGALTRHKVTVVKDFAEVPLLMLDKPRLLQILVNLIGNAKQAMDGVADRLPQIALRVDIADLAGQRSLRIRVEDNGEGIAPENLGRLFAHGFTTRKNGHGFGLHSCVLAVKEMGGTLTAHSDGPGRGATFTLELPINTAEGTQ
ncbi:ATP-binding protein [Polaromonas sp.]|uniref:sensor histidine kinase n=1 Tax=Polaromonas sp. TaxID=1869339 RepID=UPI0032641678